MISKTNHRVEINDTGNSSNPKSLVPRYKWHEVDNTCKKEFLLDVSEVLIELNKSLSPADMIDKVKRSINAAAKQCLPMKKHNVTKFRKKANNPEIANALSLQKHAYDRWVSAGKPDLPHALTTEKISTQKYARSLVRREKAMQITKLYSEIENAHEWDKNLMHKLIKTGKGPSHSNSFLLEVNGQLTECPITQRNGWAKYFEDLALPKEHDRKSDMLEHIRYIAKHSNAEMIVTPTIVQQAVRYLNKNKSPDKDGIVAEHFYLMLETAETLKILETVLQHIIDICIVPKNAKESIKVPIEKKTVSTLFDGFRGLSLSSMFYKLIESTCIAIFGKDINKGQHDLQTGFTKGVSPFLSSLMITESLADAYDRSSELYICFLDARKAFDVVQHPLMKYKLYCTGIPITGWNLIDQLYQDCVECVRWAGSYSESYNVHQGVKQGGLLSAPIYKNYSNHFADHVQKSGVGFKIGNINIATPVDADDTALISESPYELQTMMTYADFNAQNQYFQNHPTKSAVLTMLEKKENTDSYFNWMLGKTSASQYSSMEHLGLVWKRNELSPGVNNKIAGARRIAFGFTRIGLHGNGINPVAALGIVGCYIEPRLLTGLNATVLNNDKVVDLDRFYHRLIRQLQNISENTAREACYLFLGALPVKALLHIRVFEMFGQICRLNAKHKINQIATRQLAIKEQKSKSWFIYVQSIAATYDIDIHNQIVETFSKNQWKNYTKEAVVNKVFNLMIESIKDKTTLGWIIPELFSPGRAHPLWNCGSPRQTQGASIRLKLLVGRYGLGMERIKYNPKANKVCPMCSSGSEDLHHIFFHCPETKEKISNDIHNLQTLYEDNSLRSPCTQTEIISAILNGVAYHQDIGVNLTTKKPFTVLSEESHFQGNTISNKICIQFHVKRKKAMELLACID